MDSSITPTQRKSVHNASVVFANHDIAQLEQLVQQQYTKEDAGKLALLSGSIFICKMLQCWCEYELTMPNPAYDRFSDA